MGSYHPLHDGWTLTRVDEASPPVPARVPGCVHTDLLAAGLIPEPFLDDNETRLGWIGRADWAYETSFPYAATGESNVDIVCAGLDTVATVSVNGTVVGRTANMHRSFRLPVRHVLRDGENRLTVRFDSAYRYAERLRDELGNRPRAFSEPYPFIRKMACNFGWDWGPTLVTAGIWRPIGLHAWSVARLETVCPLVTVDGRDGRVEVHASLERAGDAPLTLTATIGEIRSQVDIPAGQTTAIVRLLVPDPALWWPRGYGGQPRYELSLSLSTADGTVLDQWRRRIGFRSVRLDTTPDAHGVPFTVVVNDVPVFVRGVNWIPDDSFPSRVGRDRYRTRLTQAYEANVNFLRVWGGGIYESDDFYDVADELGLMVGQDFLFACAAYPEEEPLRSEVIAEARDNVVRLAAHPSLVLWTGNNENIWGFHDWDWRESLGGRTWGAGYYHDVLPAIVAELDPTRPYWPGSPYSGSPDRHPNGPAYGTTHIWDVWNSHDYLHYRSYRPRFVAEFGFQAPATYATVRRAITDDPLAPDSPGMRHHQKADDGAGKLRRGLQAHLPEPRDFDDWHFLTQVNQARAITLGVEHFRALRPLCMGTILWQLNDCWPVTSWAAVDGDGRRKPLWYALRRAYADRLLTIQPRDAGLVLVAVNDGIRPWSAHVEVARLELTGHVCAKTDVPIEVAPGSVTVVPLPPDLVAPGRADAELLLAEADGERAWWFFTEDRHIGYPAPDYDAVAEPTPEGVLVTVTARTLLRDLTLFPDRLDPRATVDEALITLLPGDSAMFTVRTGAALDPTRLTSRPVLRCINDLGGYQVDRLPAPGQR
jgi:beta-mannosidase